MKEPFNLGALEAASLIRERRLSAVELMESLISRSEALEPALKVWVTLNPNRAMAAAIASQRGLESHGPRGPLHGVPVGVKDIFYTRGMKTTACSPIYADFVPDHDATAVVLLKRAGAIVMGKTVTTQFACGDPPPTRNPWDSAHTPGGSSSGSAVGTACRMFPFALGSQTAGSVLRPAAYNGVVGLKPTFGRISRFGVIPVSGSLDTVGTFTRTVEDAAVVLRALAGHDTSDPASSDVPVPDYGEELRTRTRPPRIGVVRKHFYERSNDEVRAHFDSVVSLFDEAGADVREVRLDADVDALLAAHHVVANAEAAEFHETHFRARPDDYAPSIRGMLKDGLRTRAISYVQAQRVRREFQRRMDEAICGFDILLCPTTAEPAPRDLTTTGNPWFQTPWTNCGFPTVALPSGLSESGLPLSVQLAAAPFAEGRLLAAARWCEEVLDVDLIPPV